MIYEFLRNVLRTIDCPVTTGPYHFFKSFGLVDVMSLHVTSSNGTVLMDLSLPKPTLVPEGRISVGSTGASFYAPKDGIWATNDVSYYDKDQGDWLGADLSTEESRFQFMVSNNHFSPEWLMEWFEEFKNVRETSIITVHKTLNRDDFLEVIKEHYATQS